MKILHIINSLATGGAEKLLLETLPLYNNKGIQVDLLVLNGTDYPFMQELKALNCCNIYSLGTSSVYNPFLIFKIIPYLKKYTTAHVHLFPAQYWVVIAKIISLSKINLFFTEHSTSNRRIRGNFIIRTIDVFFYRRFQKIICITNSVKDALLTHTKINSRKFFIISNGVNIIKVKNADPILKSQFFFNSKNDDVVLLQVSSFQYPKDQPTLIKALQFLPDSVKLLLVGDGVLKQVCESLVQELNLKDRVLFLGLRMDVPALLKTADIIVLSSKYEGLSLSSIEGMASGKPFLASNVPGLADVVGGAGVLFEQGNSELLAAEIEKLIADKNYYESVAKACQERASQYDIHIMVDKHISLYENSNEN